MELQLETVKLLSVVLSFTQPLGGLDNRGGLWQRTKQILMREYKGEGVKILNS